MGHLQRPCVLTEETTHDPRQGTIVRLPRPLIVRTRRERDHRRSLCLRVRVAPAVAREARHWGRAQPRRRGQVVLVQMARADLDRCGRDAPVDGQRDTDKDG